MIHAIIVWALHNRLIVLLATIALICVGVHATLNLNIEAYPDPTPPLIDVISQNPGASPEEVERLITIPLETALNGIPGLEYIRSTSISGLSDIKCQFAYGTSYGAARQEVLNRLNMVDLPSGVRPELSPWSPTGEIVRYVLEGPGYSTNQLKATQDWVLNRIFKQVPGVIDVVGFGGTVKQYQVLVDSRLLQQYHVTLSDVEDAIAKSNSNVGGDILTLGTQSHNVRAIGLLGGGEDPLDPANIKNADAIESAKIQDIRNVVVSTSDDGTPVYVFHVAKVIVGNQPRQGIVGRGEENDVVEGIVMMRKGEKSLATAQAVAAKIKQIEEEGLLPPGMKIQYFNQRTDLVHVTTHNVMHNLLVGVGLVIAVLFVFLGDIKSALIVALVIPLALLFAISLLYFQGMSANLLSIGAVDFGIIVDSSVIIVETIFRHLAEPSADRSRSLIDRIADASHSVERPMLFSTIIIVCAFIPLFTLSGPAGAMFGPMALTYAFSILGALLISITLAPVLCSFFFTGEMKEHETILDRALKYIYSVTLTAALKQRGATVAVSTFLIVATLIVVPQIGAEFMPQLEEGNLWVRAYLPRTVSREEASRFAPRLRKVIASVPEVRGVMSQVGRPDDGTDVTSFFNVEFNVPLNPMETWRPGMTRQKIEDELTEKFKAFPGIEFSFSQLIRDNIDEALSGIKGSNSVKLFGSDLAMLEEVGARVADSLRSVKGIENVGLFDIIGQPNLEITIDRKACARYGINVEHVEDAIRVAIGGKAFSQMVEGEKLYDIVLRLPADLRNDPENIARLPIDIPSIEGRPRFQIPLAHLAKIEPHKPGASYIYRENNRRFLPIKFSVRGRDLASAIQEARDKVSDPKEGAKLPPGYRVEWSGEFAQMQAANAVLKLTVPLSIALILVVLYVMFNSLKDTGFVMIGVIIAMVGGVWALMLTQTSFSISAAVGFISIFGVVVQNGVLLINDFNRQRREGRTVNDAVFSGSITLFRPVVMISLTAILGLLPAALATSVGSQAQKPLAIVVVGGMFVAMILPQYVLPALYTYFPLKVPPHDTE
ncbi:MAG: efflux RND transporter permease subunit [Planctomycetaceae bacterium]